MLNYEEVRRLLDYDPETGILTWKIPRRNTVVGQEAGRAVTRCNKPYRAIHICGKQTMSHKVAFLWMTGRFPVEEVDHQNGNGRDNRWTNLREVTRLENNKNRRRYSNNKSGQTGVCWAKREKRWRVSISVSKQPIILGYFISKEKAIAVRKAAEITYGFHPNHGSDRPL